MPIHSLKQCWFLVFGQVLQIPVVWNLELVAVVVVVVGGGGGGQHRSVGFVGGIGTEEV